MNSLIVVCCLLVVAVTVESRARPTELDIEKHDVQMDHDVVHKQSIDTTEPMVELMNEVVTRSTDVLVEKKTVPIDWKSFIEIVSVVLKKIHELFSAIVSKLLSYALVKAAPFIKDNLLSILIPEMIDNEVAGKAVASSFSVDWRSAANTIFDTLLKFQSLQNN